MTRESKLALIVGFGLVLFVGILVSDHFSAGQRKEAAHLLAQRGALRGASAPISIQPLLPETSAVRVAADEPRGASPNAEEAAIDGNSRPPVAPGGPAPAAGHGEIVVGGPSATPAIPRVPVEPTPSAPAPRLYPVKEGETLYSICQSQYGDGSLWKELAEFNRNAVPNPSRLRKGVTLRIPPIEQLKPGAVARGSSEPAAPGGTPGSSPRTAPGAPTAPPAATASTYTIRAGETLSEIARRELGSTSRWKDLAKFNQDVIRDPNALQPGTVIRLPS
ncbi:MAG: LysM peptidoglycan-binding domain-containing protein [Phycisphaerae bacterium]|nr:LysM peptidoglycan-binding domain-containing protein [Phycisphaerae bacterium]